jgi:hypothetical protein
MAIKIMMCFLVFLFVWTATVVSDESQITIDATGEVNFATNIEEEDTEFMLEYARKHMREEMKKKKEEEEKQKVEEEKQKKEEEKKEAYRSARGICVDCFSYNGTLFSGGSLGGSSGGGDGGAVLALLLLLAVASHLTTCTIHEISCQAVNILSTYVPVLPQYLALLVTPLVTFVILLLSHKCLQKRGGRKYHFLISIPLAGCCLLKWYLLSVLEVGFLFFTLEIFGFIGCFFGYFYVTDPNLDSWK